MLLSAKEYLKNDDCAYALYIIVQDLNKMTELSMHLYTRKMPDKLIEYYNSVITRAREGEIEISECIPSKSKRLPTYCTEKKKFYGSHIAILNLIAHCYKPKKKLKNSSKMW